MNNITQIIGIAGSGIVLIGFVMLQHRKWNSESIAYLLSQLIGSFLLILYAVMLKSYPFIVLNSLFVFVAMKKIIELKSKKR